MQHLGQMNDQIARLSDFPQNDDQVCIYITEFLKATDWKGTVEKPLMVDGYSNGFTFGNITHTFKVWSKGKKRLQYLFADSPFQFFTQAHNDNIIISDSYMKTYQPSIPTWPYFFGTYYCEMEFDLLPPTKKINYLTNRVTRERLATLYELYNEGLIERCNISLINDANNNLSDFHPECLAQSWFKEKMPFRNFTYTLEQSIIDCGITIVHESEIYDHVIPITEKTFRVLQLPRPFVIFGSVGLVSWLRDMGFQTGDRYIDHSYDTIADAEVRRKAVCQTAMKFVWDDTMQDYFTDVSEFNKSKLKHLKAQFPDKIREIMETQKW